MNVDQLFDALAKNQNMTLERLYVWCLTVTAFTTLTIRRLLNAHPEIRFLCVEVGIMTEVENKNLNTYLKNFARDPQKILKVITNSTDDDKKVGGIPIIHLREMTLNLSNVCAINIFNGFLNP